MSFVDQFRAAMFAEYLKSYLLVRGTNAAVVLNKDGVISNHYGKQFS